MDMSPAVTNEVRGQWTPYEDNVGCESRGSSMYSCFSALSTRGSNKVFNATDSPRNVPACTTHAAAANLRPYLDVAKSSSSM